MTSVTNYPRITLSSGLVGVVVDTSIDDTLKGKCMCEAMQHLRASAVAAMLRDPDDTSRCLLDYEAASRLTDEDYKAFWKALGYTLAYMRRGEPMSDPEVLARNPALAYAPWLRALLMGCIGKRFDILSGGAYGVQL